MSDIKQELAVHDEVENLKSEDVQVTHSHADRLSIWQAVRANKLIGLTAMGAAFSASLDGYQINLNGGIVSNKGFIKQMASPGTKIINGKYISAWGGVQSAGQFFGQVGLQYITERFGRKVALYIIWLMFVASVMTETFATEWDHWLVAKLLSGMGVGMLQSTMPMYIGEISPTQLRGLFINAYTFWFVVGQLFASVALNRLHLTQPLDFRTPIYTQWAMVGVAGIIFVFLPESPWWLVSQDRPEDAERMLQRYHQQTEDFDTQEQVNVMTSTIEHERVMAEQNRETGPRAVFQGKNLLRLVIAAWPKVTQQLVGLSVFNTYATYFFQYAGNKNPFLVTVILSSVQLLSVLVTAVTTDKVGRRPLTVYPYAVTAVSVLCLGIIGCFDYKDQALSSLLIFFACLATFSTTGASGIGYAYAAEIPQQRLRARTNAFGLAFSNLIAIMFSFCTPLMINGTTAHWGVKTGFFFAGTGSVAVIIAWFILPEVTCRTPAEIDQMFEQNIPLRKFHTWVSN